MSKGELILDEKEGKVVETQPQVPVGGAEALAGPSAQVIAGGCFFCCLVGLGWVFRVHGCGPSRADFVVFRL